jgi:hypothetical protein
MKPGTCKATVVAVAVLFCAEGATPTLAAGPMDLAAHRALYEISLAATRAGSEITDLKGRMVLEWADACDGWTVNQKVRMDLSHMSGPAMRNEFSFSSYESKDGDDFRFSMRSMADGEQYEEYVGKARRDGKNSAADFETPGDIVLELPIDVMFPSQHLFILVERALAGDRVVSMVVFSGTGPESLHDVTAFVGQEIPAGTLPLDIADESDSASPFGDLAAMRSWPVAMAYFPHAQDDLEPEFEVSYRLLENGVAGNLLLDYGEFSMRAVLEKFEYLDPPDC